MIVILQFTICNADRCSAGPRTTCVPPPEVPQGCGRKENGQLQGWSGSKTAKLPRVDSVRSTENWQQVYCGGQGACAEGGGGETELHLGGSLCRGTY